MLSLEDAQIRIKKEIEIIDLPLVPKDLYDPVRYILSLGGKRIRPALVLLGANLFSDDISSAVNPAIGIEIFHNFTLLHDDLMDNSVIRRGKETVHIKWSPNISILSGDVMSILAGKYISKTNSPNYKDIQDTFNRTAIEVCEGQMLDMDFERRTDVSIQEYLEMIRLKTSVLIAASLEIGALAGGADKKSAAELYEFGLNLGLAFQLQDDLLDSYGDTKTFGKKVGNDILTNKKTYLMITALNNSKPEDKARLLDILGWTTIDPFKKIDAVKAIYDACSVKALTIDKINQFFDLALQKLENINIEDDRKIVLKKFSAELKGREY
ncbi:MAG: polyprenyl synthetase family protein [Bacteroidales bacterium]|nr:polyprenyl synthetase family protein [Bacteroidales bacterium]MCF8391468.1 polyprenyl synthetase family protein [Bacteroidales bacterium]